MEPVTHMLTGAVLARTGLNRKAAYMTAAMAIAAELPDIDTVSSFWGPITGFEHHRGITHTFVAIPLEAALMVLAAWLWHRLRKPARTKAPVSWGWLYLGCLVALLSHILLDWTNNYGVRPFFPFNPHWYAGSFVFIFEPVLFVLLLAALAGPALFGLIGSEVGSKRAAFPGRGWAVAVLVGVAFLYLFRYEQRQKAMALTSEYASAATLRVFASPHPGNPFLWHVVTETDAAYQLSTVNSRLGQVMPADPADTLYKPSTTLALLAAKRTYLGHIYLDWSMFPVLSEASIPGGDPRHPLTEVTFADARFLYDAGPMHARVHPPLSGSVTLDMHAPEGQRVVEMQMDQRIQRRLER